MRALLRDLLRQRWRTALTVLGIAIGIFALVVFGAMAEHFRSLVAESKGYIQGTVRLVTKTNKEGVNPGISAQDRATARAIPGVRDCVPTLTLLLDGYNLEDDPFLMLSPHPLVEGLPPGLAEGMRPGVRLVEGRWLRDGDTQVVMLARWLAKRRGWRVGEKHDMRHLPTEVVGIYEAPETVVVPAAIAPLDVLKRSVQAAGIESARRFLEGFSEQVPFFANMKPKQLEALAARFVSEQEDRFYLHEVVPERASDPVAVQDVAARARDRLPHCAVLDPASLSERMEKAFGLFLAITLVISLVSSVVGGLLIVNTMAMAVVERRREIAIKVAVGASTAQIVAEFLFESAAIGLSGGVLGTLAGALAIALLDPWIVGQMEVGSSVFRLTPSLVLSTLGFGTVTGVLAGLAPAIRAARAEPAPGLREL